MRFRRDPAGFRGSVLRWEPSHLRKHTKHRPSDAGRTTPEPQVSRSLYWCILCHWVSSGILCLRLFRLRFTAHCSYQATAWVQSGGRGAGAVWFRQPVPANRRSVGKHDNAWGIQQFAECHIRCRSWPFEGPHRPTCFGVFIALCDEFETPWLFCCALHTAVTRWLMYLLTFLCMSKCGPLGDTPEKWGRV